MSNLFLVQGETIQDAVAATRLAFDSGIGVWEPVVCPDAKRSKETWLVVYLGVAGSTPLQFLFTAVDQDGTRIRVSFTPNGRSATDDSVPYFAWVPLGKAKPGKYTIELFHSTAKEVLLSRLVRIRD